MQTYSAFDNIRTSICRESSDPERSQPLTSASFTCLKTLCLPDLYNWNALNIRKIHYLLMNDLDDPLIVGKWKKEGCIRHSWQLNFI